MTILEAKFAPLLIERFLMSSTPMVFGLGKIQVGAKLTRIRNSNVRYSIDFSGFDASVPVGLIVRAFNILRTHFDFIDEEDDRAWEQVQNYFIHTPMMLPDQQVFQTSGGVPSGSYFTQLVDSIINYMCVQYMMLKVFGYFAKEDKALVLGDDAAIGVDEYRPLAQLASAFGDLGLKLNVGKTGVTRYRKGDVHFLGHYWPTCLPDRPVEEIVKRLAFPEKVSGIKEANLRQLVRLLSMVGDSQSVLPLVYQLAPYKGPSIRRRFLSLLDLFEARGNTRLMTDLTVVPGWRAHL